MEKCLCIDTSTGLEFACNCGEVAVFLCKKCVISPLSEAACHTFISLDEARALNQSEYRKKYTKSFSKLTKLKANLQDYSHSIRDFILHIENFKQTLIKLIEDVCQERVATLSVMEKEVTAKIFEVSQQLYKIDDRGNEMVSVYKNLGLNGILSNYSEFLLIDSKDAVRSIESMIYIGDDEQEFNIKSAAERMEKSERYRYSIAGPKIERLDRESGVSTEHSVFDLDLTQIGAKACLLPDGDVMIVGNANFTQNIGGSNREVCDTIRFNTKTLESTKVGNLNHRRGFVGLCCYDNILYAFGGKRIIPISSQLQFVHSKSSVPFGGVNFPQQHQTIGFASSASASLQQANSSPQIDIMKESEMMSLNSNSWTNLPSMTIPKFNSECFSWNGKIIIVGHQKSDIGDLEYYDMELNKYTNFNLRFSIQGSITYRQCEEILFILLKNNGVPTDLIVLSHKSDSSADASPILEYVSKVRPNKLQGFTYQSSNGTRKVWISLSEEALTFHESKDGYRGIHKSIKIID